MTRVHAPAVKRYRPAFPVLSVAPPKVTACPLAFFTSNNCPDAGDAGPVSANVAVPPAVSRRTVVATGMVTPALAPAANATVEEIEPVNAMLEAEEIVTEPVDERVKLVPVWAIVAAAAVKVTAPLHARVVVLVDPVMTAPFPSVSVSETDALPVMVSWG